MSEPPTQAIIDSYELNLLFGSENLLDLFLFNSSEDICLFRMHPEMLQVDTAHGTNKEKKELFTLASSDGNNKAFNATKAYILNAQ